MRISDWSSDVCSSDLPAPESGGSTEYINHHLQHLQVSVGDGQFMTLNVDTLFFTALLSLLFLFFFIRSARKATAGVPGKFQTLVEIIVGFVAGLVRETFHGRSEAPTSERQSLKRHSL